MADPKYYYDNTTGKKYWYKTEDDIKFQTVPSPVDITDPSSITNWIDINDAGSKALLAGLGTTYPLYSPTTSATTGTAATTATTNKYGATKLMSADQYTKEYLPSNADEQDEKQYALYGKPDEPAAKSLTLADLYKQNMALYGAQIPLQFRSLFQKTPVVPQIPYARTYAPESVSNVVPATTEINRQQGMANAIGARLGMYGNAGLMMMPGVIANTQSEANKNMALVGESENKRINDQLTAQATADTANSTAKATAELQRLQLQASSNTASQTEKAAAISNITDILTKMANQRTDYYEAKQLEQGKLTSSLLQQILAGKLYTT